MDDHAADDTRESAQHVVERDETVWENHTLDRRVRDVALVPQRDVLERRLRVCSNNARKTTNLFRGHRIAFVGHRRRTLLAGGEGLFDFADFGALQVTHFKRDLLHRRCNNCKSREEFGVAVALNYLSRDGRRLQRELCANPLFDLGIEMREGANRPRYLAVIDHFTSTAKSFLIALVLGVIDRQHQTERRRLGVHAVSAPLHCGVLVLYRAAL